MTHSSAKVPLPAWFDIDQHRPTLDKLVRQKLGSDWIIESIDTSTMVAHACRKASVTEVTETDTDSMRVRLGEGTTVSEGPKVAQRLESQYPGYRMSAFSPALRQATMTRMDDDTYSARRSIASALRCQPWDMQITPVDGGYDVDLPANYTTAAHLNKLIEVIENDVGAFGWIVDVDPRSLKAVIRPALPATLPALAKVDLNTLGNQRDQVPFGVAPARQGEDPEVVSLDFNSAHGVLVQGLPGGGKSVVVNGMIASQLAGGCELVVVDTQEKANDFAWCKPFVRNFGWGCDSLAAAVTVLALVRQEGRDRASIMAQGGYKNWLDMPKDEQFAPLLVVVDEATALMVLDPKPRGLDKDHPLMIEVNESNSLKAMIYSHLNHIIQELRFVGVRVILSSQIMNQASGLPPTFKDKFGHRILVGATPSRTQINQAFQDPAAVPEVPDHIATDPKASKGAGTCHLEGSGGFVFKGLFLDSEDAHEHLKAIGVPTHTNVCPTPAQIAAHSPIEGDGSHDPVPSKITDASGFGQAISPDVDKPLKGAARAAHEAALLKAMSK